MHTKAVRSFPSKWVVLDDPGAQDGRLFGEPRVGLEVSEAGAGDVQGGISPGDDPLGAPEHFGRDPRYGLGDEQDVAEFEVLPTAWHSVGRSAVGQGVVQLAVALERGAEPRLKGGVLATTLDVGSDGLPDLVADRDAVDTSHFPQEILLVRFEA